MEVEKQIEKKKKKEEEERNERKKLAWDKRIVSTF